MLAAHSPQNPAAAAPTPRLAKPADAYGDEDAIERGVGCSGSGSGMGGGGGGGAIDVDSKEQRRWQHDDGAKEQHRAQKSGDAELHKLQLPRSRVASVRPRQNLAPVYDETLVVADDSKQRMVDLMIGNFPAPLPVLGIPGCPL